MDRQQIVKEMTVDELIDSFLFSPTLSWEKKEIILSAINNAIDEKIEAEKKRLKDHKEAIEMMKALGTMHPSLSGDKPVDDKMNTVITKEEWIMQSYR